MLGSAQPIYVLSKDAEREHGKSTQLDNIKVAQALSSIIQSTLGPKSFLKLLLDPLGGIVITNDGNAILREIDVMHPVAKSLIELNRAQDEEVGDGTTSVIILAAEILAQSESALLQSVHPTQLVKGYLHALDKAIEICDEIATIVDTDDNEKIWKIIRASLRTKFSKTWGDIIADLALQAAKIVKVKNEFGKVELDIKRYIKIEKIPGGDAKDCQVVRGVAIEKDVTHSQMRRRIVNPRIVLLDCTLEYKKGESMTNVEITNEKDFERLLIQEEEEIRKMVECIASVKCDLVITEKGVSDLAAHYLMKHNISVVRRAKKTEQTRLAKITGARIVNRCEEIKNSDVGLECGLFEVKKINDDYWSFLTELKDPKACTILLRGGSKDSLNEIERNLHDALAVSKNIIIEPKLLPGGGAVEVELYLRMKKYAESIRDLTKYGFLAVANALQIIPKILINNSGAEITKVYPTILSKHIESENGINYGIDGQEGKICNAFDYSIFDTFSVKAQILKSAIECCAMIIRVDDIISGINKKQQQS